MNASACEVGAAPVDRRQEFRAVVRRLAGRLSLISEDREVMVVAEQVGQAMDLVSPRLELLRPRVAHEAEVVPVVLRALPPFMEPLGGRVLLGFAHPLAAAPVRPLEPRDERLGDAIGPVRELGGDPLGPRTRILGGPARTGTVMRPRPAIEQVRAERNDARRFGELTRVLDHLLERLEHDVGIADPAKRVAGGAEVVVRGRIRLLAQFRPNEPKQRAQLLQVLARRVHRLLGLLCEILTERFEGVAGAADRCAPDLLVERMAVTKPVVA